MGTFLFSGFPTRTAKLPRCKREDPGQQRAGPPTWPSTHPEQATSMDTLNQNVCGLPECPPVMSTGTGPEPRAWWPGIIVLVVVCSLWASASLASSEQQGLFPVPSTQVSAGLFPGDFSRAALMQNAKDQSQEPWGLTGRAVPLNPEVPTGPEGKRSAPGIGPFFHEVFEGSDNKGASWWAGGRQSQASFPFLFLQHLSLGIRSRLPPQIRALHAKVPLSLKTQAAVLAVGPQKDFTEKSLVQKVNQKDDDDDDSLTTGLPPSSQTQGTDSLGVMRSTESEVFNRIGGNKTDLQHYSFSTAESAPPASTSEVHPNSRVLPPPRDEASSVLSSSNRTHPSLEPSVASRFLSLPKEAGRAFNATSFSSLGGSLGKKTESHVPKLLRSTLFSHSSEHFREQITFLAPRSWLNRSGFRYRGSKKVVTTSKESSPPNPLTHIWISTIAPPFRPLEHSAGVIGPDQEILATIKEHERYSRVAGLGRLTDFATDPILQYDLSSGRSTISSGPAPSPGVFESATTTGLDESSALGFLLSLPPRAFRGVKPEQGPSSVPAAKGLSLLALGNEETDSPAVLLESPRATSELPQLVPTLVGEMPGSTAAQEPTSVSLYRPSRHMLPQAITTLQPHPSHDPPEGSAYSQPLVHDFTSASFPSGREQDSGWMAETKTYVATLSLVPLTETPPEAVPGASAKPQTSQVHAPNAAAEASGSTLNQAGSKASALQPQDSPVATMKQPHHSENSASARSSNQNSPETRAPEEGPERWTTLPFPARATHPRSPMGGGRTKPSPLLSSPPTPAQLARQGTMALVTSKPLISSQSTIPGSLEMPEEQLDRLVEVKVRSASLDQVVPPNLAIVLLEPQTTSSSLAPPTTWASALPSEQEKSQVSPTQRQEKIPWLSSIMSHTTRWLGSSPSPSSLMTEPPEGFTSPMALPSHPGPTRGGLETVWVFPISPQSTSGKEDLTDFPTSGTGSTGTARTSTPGKDSQEGSEILPRTIPLQFRLNQISYIPALEDRYSIHFRRLKWEVTLTFRRMLSHMNGFQEFYLLYFFNGSVSIQSEVEVYADPSPTSSDLIRWIVTMVHQKMDTYFSWKVDLSSLYSNGYRIENLEPEILPVSFMTSGFPVNKSDTHHLEKLRHQVIQDLGKLYPVIKVIFADMRETQGKMMVMAKVFVQSQGWADIPSVLRALTGLANLSVDLSSLTVADSHLDLQLLPISFLVINGSLKKSLLEPLTPEHEAFLTELARGVKQALSSYSDLLQVTIQDCQNDSLICVGDLLFQAPGPKPQNLLQTLMKAVDSNGHLAGSRFQVDPSSFLIAEENLQFSPGTKTRTGISVAVIIISILIVFIGIILTTKYVRYRLRYLEPQSLYSQLRGYQMHTEMIELTTQHETSEQQENPAFETSHIQDTMEDDSASSS